MPNTYLLVQDKPGHPPLTTAGLRFRALNAITKYVSFDTFHRLHGRANRRVTFLQGFPSSNAPRRETSEKKPIKSSECLAGIEFQAHEKFISGVSRKRSPIGARARDISDFSSVTRHF
ncbi:hypothetical protein [Burkholderia pseudomallei]|uniref:hypothetical protein n=1 Tax=Burkholderia pseudomallei TaxID=28450 RepID=UPI0011779FE7|nr:hypothetical protein [Burkholderia pseudomallei]